MAERFPRLDWKVTAGNSSQITDGAAALLVMSEERAAALGLRPRARILASAVVGDDPLLMLTGPIPATAQGARARRADHRPTSTAFEVNEAFASVPLAWQARVRGRRRACSTRAAARSPSATRSAPPAPG